MANQGRASLVTFGSKKLRVLIPLIVLAYALAQDARPRNFWARFMRKPVQTEVPKLAARYPAGTPNQPGLNHFQTITSQSYCDANNFFDDLGTANTHDRRTWCLACQSAGNPTHNRPTNIAPHDSCQYGSDRRQGDNQYACNSRHANLPSDADTPHSCWRIPGMSTTWPPQSVTALKRYGRNYHCTIIPQQNEHYTDSVADINKVKPLELTAIAKDAADYEVVMFRPPRTSVSAGYTWHLQMHGQSTHDEDHAITMQQDEHRPTCRLVQGNFPTYLSPQDSLKAMQWWLRPAHVKDYAGVGYDHSIAPIASTLSKIATIITMTITMFITGLIVSGMVWTTLTVVTAMLPALRLATYYTTCTALLVLGTALMTVIMLVAASIQIITSPMTSMLVNNHGFWPRKAKPHVPHHALSMRIAGHYIRLKCHMLTKRSTNFVIHMQNNRQACYATAIRRGSTIPRSVGTRIWRQRHRVARRLNKTISMIISDPTFPACMGNRPSPRAYYCAEGVHHALQRYMDDLYRSYHDDNGPHNRGTGNIERPMRARFNGEMIHKICNHTYWSARTDTPSMYFEKQHLNHCQLHAINMYVGRNWLKRHDIHNYCCELLDANPDNVTLTHSFDKHTGNYSDDMINYILYHTTPAHTQLITIAEVGTSHRTRLQGPETLDALANNKANVIRDSLILYTTMTNADTTRQYQHALCLKKLHGYWYLLDSLNPGPVKIESTHWQHITGKIVIMASHQPHPDCAWGDTNSGTTVLSIGHPTDTADLYPAGNPPPKKPRKTSNQQRSITDYMQVTQTCTQLTQANVPAHTHIPNNAEQTTCNNGANTANNNDVATTQPTQRDPTTTHHATAGNLPMGTRANVPHAHANHFDAGTDNTTYSLSIYTHNIQGIRANMADIDTAVTTCMHGPDVIVITETHLTADKNNKIKGIQNKMKDYNIFTSSIPKSKCESFGYGRRQYVRGHAGVLVAIHKRISRPDKMSQVNVDKQLNGYVCHVQLHSDVHGTTAIMGVYATPTNPTVKDHVHRYVTKHSATHRCIAVGDWNAAMYQQDRYHGNMHDCDNKHQRFAAGAALTPIDPQSRLYTYTPHAAETNFSRIDDILLNKAMHTALSPSPRIRSTTLPHDGSSDHCPLVVHVECNHPLMDAYVVYKPKSDPGPPRFQLPIPSQTLHTLRRTLHAQHKVQSSHMHFQAHEALQDITIALNNDFTPKSIKQFQSSDMACHARNTIDTLYNNIMNIINQCHQEALTTLPTYQPGRQAHLPRTENRKHKQLVHERKVLQHATYQIAQHCTDHTAFEAEEHPLNSDTNMNSHHPILDNMFLQDNVEVLPAFPENPNQITKFWATGWVAACKQKIQQLTKQIYEIKNKHTAKVAHHKESRNRHMLDTKPKTAHKFIFSDALEGDQISAVTHPATKTIQTDPDGILDAIHLYFKQLLTPTQPKTGDATPNGPFPWANPSGPDNFTLDSDAVHARDNECLYHHIASPAVFQDCLKHLSKNKQPGPDGIINELLQNLPGDLLMAMHAMFCCMWLAGHVPQGMKQSNTVLLYKKGDRTDIGNYRPIALANTIYKLWTSMVTDTLSMYAENYNLIHNTQEGFRQYRNTTRQLTNLIHTIEDAKLTNRNLYAAYIDFSSAFNTVDHDRLLQVMHALGFPGDALQVVQNIYTNNRTRIILPFGATPWINVDRGTIQGDTLSPFLFLIFMEPLLRWLDSGGRGYAYGTMVNRGDHLDRFRCSGLAYADDLVILADNHRNLPIQLQKLEAYCAWSNLRVNSKKCAATGILHGDSHSGLVSHACDTRMLKNRLHNSINPLTVQGQTLPFLEPSSPYTYLGVETCMALDWSHQLNAIKAKVSKKGEQLRGSFASERQCINIIQTVLRPAITYAFPVVPYTANDIAELDKMMCGIAKSCTGLNTYHPNAMVHSGPHVGGLGIASLLVDYAHMATKALIQHLNDDDRVGAITTALMLQLKHDYQTLPMKYILNDKTSYSILRQLALAKEHGISILINGTSLDSKSPALWTALENALKHHAAPSDKIRGGLPLNIIRAMTELKVTHLTQLLVQGTNTMVSSNDLANHLGNPVRKRHKLALNRLTLLICSQTEDPTTHLQHNSPAPLTKAARTVPNDTISDARRHQNLAGRMQDFQTWTNARTISTMLVARRGMQHEQAPQNQPGAEPTNNQDPMLIDLTTKRRRTAGTRKSKKAYMSTAREPTLETADMDEDTMHDHEKFWTTLQQGTYMLPSMHNLDWSTFRDKTMAGDKRILAPRNRPNTTLINSLYDAQDKLVAVVSGALHVSHDPKRHKQAKSHNTQNTKLHCEMMTVQWAPTVICKDHLQFYKKYMKYEPQEVTPCPPDNTWWLQHAARLAVPIENMIIVNWSPKAEPLSMLEQHDNWSTLLAQYNAHMDAQAATRNAAILKRTDTHLDNMQQQGIWYTTPIINTAERAMLLNQIHFDTWPRNPELDIQATGQFHMQYGTRTLTHPNTVINANMVYVHDPHGKLLGSMRQDRAHNLWLDYKKYTETSPGNACGSFAEEIAGLLARYKDGHKTMTSQTKIQNHWATPPPLMECFAEGLGINMERFASPLNHNPCFANYWSLYPADRVFGARHNAFSVPWTGLSQANPEYTAADMDKAVRWAIHSADASAQQTVTLFVLPDWAGTPYKQWLGHHSVDILDKIPGTQFKFMAPDHWCKQDIYAGHPKWSILIFTVSNTQGKQHILSRWQSFSHVYQVATATHGGQARSPKRPSIRHVCDMTVKPPSKLRMLLATPPMTGPAERVAHQPMDIPCPIATQPAMLARDWRTGIYTDGSCIPDPETGGNLLGAAAYKPDENRTLYIDPHGHGPSNTINRAELSAIHMALRTFPVNQQLQIYTDSLCSMQLIRKVLYNPRACKLHVHGHILMDIRDAIVTRAHEGETIYFDKVKSHTGIQGNEIADQAAKAAALREIPDAAEHHNETARNDTFETLAWPAEQQKGRDGRDTWHYFGNLNQSLKHHVSTKAELGFTPEGVYSKLVADTLPYIDVTASSASWKHGRNTFSEQRTSSKYMWGGLYNARTAHKWAHGAPPANPSDAPCPLCARPDSGTHMLNECTHPHITGLRINRHNEAVRLLQKYIGNGDIGGYHTIMDAGRADNLPEGVSGTRVPEWMLPDLDPQHRIRMRPDIMILEKAPATLSEPDAATTANLKQKCCVHLVELGYCGDLRMPDKLKEKQRQHEQLSAALVTAGWEVKSHILVLGVAGTIYKYTADDFGEPQQPIKHMLKELGIPADKGPKLLMKLSSHAKRYAHSIVVARRKLEQPMHAGPHTVGPVINRRPTGVG